MAKDKHSLAQLIDSWLEDYSFEDFQDEFGFQLSVGEMISLLFEAGEVPYDVIAKFMED